LAYHNQRRRDREPVTEVQLETLSAPIVAADEEVAVTGDSAE
jgi:hypothetical protein